MGNGPQAFALQHRLDNLLDLTNTWRGDVDQIPAIQDSLLGWGTPEGALGPCETARCARTERRRQNVSNLSALHIEMEGNACDSSDDEAYKESNGVTEDAGLVEAMEAIVFSEEVWGQREWGENDVSHLALPDYGNDISSMGMKRQRVN